MKTWGPAVKSFALTVYHLLTGVQDVDQVTQYMYTVLNPQQD